MKAFKRLSTLILAIIAINASAQREIIVKEYKGSSLIPVASPILIDSTDVNKKGFSDKNLLQTSVDFEKALAGKNILTANDSGIVSLPYFDWDLLNDKQSKAIQILSFNITADRYCKAKIAISCTEMFEVYLNNKKEKSKETREDSLSKAGITELELTLEPPKCYNIVIKRIATHQDKNQSELKTILKLDKSNENAQVIASLNDKRSVTINDIIEGYRTTGSDLSPSGKYYIAYYNRVLPGGKSSASSELRELKTNRVLYRFPDSSRPRWMNNTDKIVYAKDGVQEKDFYTFDPLTMEESLLAEGVKYDSYTLSPDNKFMIIGIREEIPAEKGDLKRLLSPSDRAGSFRGRYSIYIYKFLDRSLQRLTFGSTQTYLSDIRPDSRKILFVTSKEDMTKRQFKTSCIMEMDMQTLQVDTITCDDFISRATYSPDFTKVLFEGSAEAFGGIGLNIQSGQISNTYDTQAFIMDLKTKEVKVITKDFNPSISQSQWSRVDNRIYFLTDDEDRRSIYAYDTKSGNFERLNLKEDMIAGFQIAESAPIALFRGESGANAYRIYSYDLKTKSAQLLSDPFGEQLAELELSPMKDWDFTSSGGSLIKGRYYLPPNFDPNKKYPVIVYYYAGTTPTTRIFESTYPLQTYAALGYVVYTIQPSGTVGYGQEFSARHVNAWGKVTADEIIEGTQKFCEAHPFADKTKIGCIGASYGGFMTQYLQTQTNIFAAAISHAGISALSSYWGEGYWGYAYSATASAGSYPWNNPQLYVEQSPLFHADKINTPLLLLHGGADTNVPIGESIQMFNALKILGKTVEFIQVEGENHAIYGYNKRIEWNKTIYAWFAKWLKDQPEWWNALYPEK